MSINGVSDRYEVLAAVSMLYKKMANESMFRLGEVAQSMIHILED